MGNGKQIGWVVGAVGLVALGLGGCGQMRSSLGMTKSSPDEFAVMTQAPLTLPPDYTLRPPQPGASRPQEAAPRQAAAQAVFGSSPGASASTSAEDSLVARAGGDNADPNVRQELDQTANVQQRSGVVTRTILAITGNGGAPEGDTIDAMDEAERLRKEGEKVPGPVRQQPAQ